MSKAILMSLAGAGLLAAGAAHAKWVPELPHMLDRCKQQVSAAFPGAIQGVETTWENDRLTYELDIAAGDGRTVSVECAAMSGKIVETEYENLPGPWNAFKSNSNLSDIQARHIALQSMPGKIVESEREYEADGRVTSEFEIVQADGKRGEIEIDARTGAVVERGYELSVHGWQLPGADRAG